MDLKHSDIQAVVKYRLSQAQEALVSAIELKENNHLSDAINRAYYSMFYSALALLASKQLGTSKHQGVISLISQYFVRPGLLPIESGRQLKFAFELRLKYDYKELTYTSLQEVEAIIDSASDFLEKTRQLLKAQKFN